MPISTPSSPDGSYFNQLPTPLPVVAQDPAINVSHLRLLHHFTTVTAETLVPEKGTEDVYHTYMVKLAFEFGFLLRSILAIAALHLSRLNPSLRTQYLYEAEQHHDAALAQFRDEIKDLDEDNYEAILLFSAMLFPYSCALPINTQNGVEHMMDNILQTFVLTRMSRPMVISVYPKLLEGPMGRIVSRDTKGIDFDQTPEETELISLRRFSEVTRPLYPLDINEAYGAAIKKLEVIFSAAARSSKQPSDSLLRMWIHLVNPRFMELLGERQPGALIIFAHFAVLFKRSLPCWYLEGVAEQMFGIAEALVPTEWKNWLEWPKAQINPGQILPDANAI